MITLAKDGKDRRRSAFMQVLGLAFGLYALLALLPALMALTPVSAMQATAHPQTAAPQGAVLDAVAQAQNFSYAEQLYREGRWSGAYGRFARLADAGDAEAARIALHMLRMGSILYGTDWGASQPQIDRWIKLAGAPLPALVSVSGD